MVFERVQEMGHENVVFCHDRDTGLRAIIAVHNTTLGPALGGVRRWTYPSEEAALTDVLRLSEAMTYKAASADLPMGGAKSVIWTDSRNAEPSEPHARAMGRFIERLGGVYIGAEDVGVNTQYIDWMAQETRYVMGGEKLARGGDPAPYTALGVVSGMRGGLKHLGESTSLKGRTIAIQGLGALGANVARIASAEGAIVYGADIRKERMDRVVKEFGVRPVPLEAVLSTECDILCPCALGGVITAATIPSLKCRILAPGANNVLGDPEEDAPLLLRRGITYCTDFVTNGGGLLQLAGLWCGFTDAELDRRIRNIENVTATILADARTSGSSYAAALAYARKRLEAGKPLPVADDTERDAAGSASMQTT